MGAVDCSSPDFECHIIKSSGTEDVDNPIGRQEYASLVEHSGIGMTTVIIPSLYLDRVAVHPR